MNKYEIEVQVVTTSTNSMKYTLLSPSKPSTSEIIHQVENDKYESAEILNTQFTEEDNAYIWEGFDIRRYELINNFNEFINAIDDGTNVFDILNHGCFSRKLITKIKDKYLLHNCIDGTEDYYTIEQLRDDTSLNIMQAIDKKCFYHEIIKTFINKPE